MAVPKTTETTCRYRDASVQARLETTQATPSLHLLPHVDVPSNLIAKLTERFRCRDRLSPSKKS